MIPNVGDFGDIDCIWARRQRRIILGRLGCSRGGRIVFQRGGRYRQDAATSRETTRDDRRRSGRYRQDVATSREATGRKFEESRENDERGDSRGS